MDKESDPMATQRNQGRPKTTRWKDDIQKVAEVKWMSRTADRSGWRQLAEACMSKDEPKHAENDDDERCAMIVMSFFSIPDSAKSSSGAIHLIIDHLLMPAL